MGWGFGAAWEHLCSYQTERMITFVDWRLGIPYKLMCFAIAYWMFTSLLVTELYLANAFPVSVFSLWASSAYHGELGTFDYVKAQGEVWADTLDAGKETTYCQNEQYNFKIMDAGGDEFDFKNVSCVFLDHSEASEIGDSHLLVVTALRNQYVSYHKKVPDQACSVESFKSHNLAPYCNEAASPKIREEYNNCYCTYSESHFAAGTENLTLTLTHEFRSRFEDGVAEVTHVRVKGNEEEIFASFEAHEEIRLPVPKILEWLEIDLDDAHPAEKKKSGKAATTGLGGTKKRSELSESDKEEEEEEEVPAPVRLKGLRVEVNLNYYNFGQAPGLEEKFTFDPGEVVCVLELEILPPTAGIVGGTLEQVEASSSSSSPPAAAAAEVNAEEAELAAWEGRTAATETASSSSQKRRTSRPTRTTTWMKPVYNNKGVRLGEKEVTKEETRQAKMDTSEVQYFTQTSSSLGRGAYVIRHKDGIHLSVTAGGVISELDVALLFETFIQAFLLLNLANIICKFIAYNLLGIKSKIFYSFGEYAVNYELEYARFAVQSIVAGHSFKKLDADGSGKLSEQEIVQALQDAQGDDTKFSREDLETLAAFIVACGDMEGDDGDDPDGEINMSEWDDLFASGFATSKLISEQIALMKRTRCASCTDPRENFIDDVERRQIMLGRKKSSKRLSMKMRKQDYYGSLEGDEEEGV